MTEEQVNRIVDHLCQQLHVALRLKGTQSEVFPPNIKDLGFDPRLPPLSPQARREAEELTRLSNPPLALPGPGQRDRSARAFLSPTASSPSDPESRGAH
jgi:hypothetical protein